MPDLPIDEPSDDRDDRTVRCRKCGGMVLLEHGSRGNWWSHVRYQDHMMCGDPDVDEDAK